MTGTKDEKTREEIEKMVAGLMGLNAVELAEATIDALKAHDSLRFAGGLDLLMRRNPAESLSVLENLIVDYLEMWGDDELPEKDAAGDTTLRSVVHELKNANLPGLFQLGHNDPAEIIHMLIAAAAALKR